MPFKAFESQVEVSGAAILSVINGMRGFQALSEKILANHGIHNPASGKWYSQQAWLNAFEEIAGNIGQTTLRTIGRRIPETALWPPDVTTTQQGLASIDVAYHMNHRGGEIGHYRYEKVSEKSARIICNNPYPCEFDMGIIEATAKRFSAPKTVVIVLHDSNVSCRDKGGRSCVYTVSW